MKSFIQFLAENKKEDIGKKFIDEIGKYKIYFVNGEKVRDLGKDAEEFGLSSSFKYHKFIPENEIWIENDVSKEESKILMYTELYRIRLIDNGMEKWKAYRDALKKEKDLRQNYKTKNAKDTDEKADEKIYIKEYCKIKEDMVVWLVDGKEVRNEYKTDFMEGGNGYVYKWVPNDEIWIEEGINEHEIPFIILHEFVEKTFMKKDKMNYDNAHDIASKVEWSKRPDNFKKKDAENLTEKEALSLGNKFKK